MTLIPADGDRLGISVITVDVLFLALAALASILRFWARQITKTALCFNDYAVIVALLLACGLDTIAILAVVTGGAGQHMIHVNSNKFTFVFKTYVVAEVLWGTVNTAIKLSILHLYITIFPNRRFHIITYILMVIVSAFCIIVVVEALIICRPFNYFWNKTIEGSCNHEVEIHVATSIINVLIDAIIIVLPMPMLWGLQLAFPKKLALALIFGLGGCICAVGVLRIITFKSFNKEDFTYDFAKLSIWTDLEPTLGIIGACLLILMPVGQRLSSSIIYLFSILSPRTRVNVPKDPNKSRDMNNFVKINHDIRPKPFNPLVDDRYQFTKVSDGITISHIRGPHRPDSKPDSITSDLEAQADSIPSNGIDVKRYWKVDSEPLKS